MLMLSENADAPELVQCASHKKKPRVMNSGARRAEAIPSARGLKRTGVLIIRFELSGATSDRVLNRVTSSKLRERTERREECGTRELAARIKSYQNVPPSWFPLSGKEKKERKS